MTRRLPPRHPEGKRAESKSERERRVTPEEASLWQQVTTSVGPAGKGKARVRAAGGVGADAAGSASAPVDARPPSPAVPSRAAREEPRKGPPAPPPPRAATREPPPPAAVFDRRKIRHLATGKIEIDARLDLHGLRQSEARYRLAHFLRSAHDRGCRVVLVITGKGAREPADRLAEALGEPQRGVLRRVVPQWLEEPDMRMLVVGFATAGPRHGGDGALYVRLRRPGRSGDGD